MRVSDVGRFLSAHPQITFHARPWGGPGQGFVLVVVSCTGQPLDTFTDVDLEAAYRAAMARVDPNWPT
jgi:hypothetical protein